MPVSKRKLVRGLTVVSCLIASVNLYSFWVLISTFAADLVWWVELLHLVAPVSALLGFVTALWRPRQPAAAAVNVGVLLLHALFVLALVVG